MTDHRIIATDWQLKAAQEGTLDVAILPLVPQIKMHQDGSFLWGNKIETSWMADSVDQICNCPEFPYQIGDCIYLAEKWCKDSWGWTNYKKNGYCVRSVSLSTDPDCVWQSAETMPIEATDHCFVVKSVLVVQMGVFTTSNLRRTGLGTFHDRSGNFTAKENWNTAHPDFPWGKDKWVILLEIAKS